MHCECALILGAAAILVACGASEVPATSAAVARAIPIEIGAPGQVPKHAQIEIPGCAVTRSDELELTLRALCTTDPGLFFKVEERTGDPKAPKRILHNAKTPEVKLVDSIECCACLGPLKPAPDAEAVFLDTWVDGRCAPSGVSASSAKFTCDLRRGKVDEACCEKRNRCAN